MASETFINPPPPLPVSGQGLRGDSPQMSHPLRSEGYRRGPAALCEEAGGCHDPHALLPQHLCAGWAAALHGDSEPEMCQDQLWP